MIAQAKSKGISVSRWCLPLVLTVCVSGCLEGPDPDREGRQGYSVSTPPEPEPFVDAEGFVHLRLTDFETFPATESPWTETDGVLLCQGRPKGYLYSKKEYSNFTWRCEFRFLPGDHTPEELAKANTGFMLHIQPPHKVWPASLEVQGRFDEMASLKSNGGAPALDSIDSPEVREQVRKLVGEWNTIEITSYYGRVAAYLNGEKISECPDTPLKGGLIGLQSEGFAVEFRNSRIRIES